MDYLEMTRRIAQQVREQHNQADRKICESHAVDWIATDDEPADMYALVESTFQVTQEGITRIFTIDDNNCIFCNA